MGKNGIQDYLEYKLLFSNLTIQEVARIYGALEKSRVLEVADESVTGRLNHIVLKWTAKVIGYIGADNQIELVNPQKDYLKISHAYFKSLVEDCLEENQRVI